MASQEDTNPEIDESQIHAEEAETPINTVRLSNLSQFC